MELDQKALKKAQEACLDYPGRLGIATLAVETYWRNLPREQYRCMNVASELLEDLKSTVTLLSAFIGPDDDLGMRVIKNARRTIAKAEGTT